jgi:RHS repeat-associated protein
VSTGEVTYTPYSPWGELLAHDPTRGPPTFPEGNIPASGISLPDFGDFPGHLPPLGLAGHLIEQDTGLVVMHHRTYHPRLGHFLTPDFRPPSIDDPSTFSEPYAYAAGNPVFYWDPDGLHSEAGVIKAYTQKYGDDEEAMMALLLIMQHYSIEQGDQWLNDWSVDHEKRQIQIAATIGFGSERSNENAADQLYQALHDDPGFYSLLGLSETWGGFGRRVGEGGLKVLGGGLSVVGGGLLWVAPDVTTLTKIGGTGAIVFGSNTFVEGGTQIFNRTGGINLLGEAADAYERSVAGGLSDEWYMRSRTWMTIGGTAFEFASAGGYSKLLRTTSLRELPTATKDALTTAMRRFRARKFFKGLGNGKTSPWLLDTRAAVVEHLEEFRCGGSWFMTKKQYNMFVKGKSMVGDPAGQFIMTKAYADKVLAEAGGDIAKFEKMLGFPKGHFSSGGGLVRIDVHNPLLHNIRMASGLERGANELFLWGGYTSGGIPEAVIDALDLTDATILILGSL